eukprot:GHVN01059087.1.p1 GENE.GHVN01059087.1~~GHVN01059087.1.p1  ORF type:complete len:1228 (+),score=138.44 GHVN01059087.1:104-3787(+)
MPTDTVVHKGDQCHNRGLGSSLATPGQGGRLPSRQRRPSSHAYTFNRAFEPSSIVQPNATDDGYAEVLAQEAGNASSTQTQNNGVLGWAKQGMTGPTVPKRRQHEKHFFTEEHRLSSFVTRLCNKQKTFLRAPMPFRNNRKQLCKPISIFTGTWNTEYQEFPLSAMLSSRPGHIAVDRQGSSSDVSTVPAPAQRRGTYQPSNRLVSSRATMQNSGWNKRMTMDPKILEMCNEEVIKRQRSMHGSCDRWDTEKFDHLPSCQLRGETIGFHSEGSLEMSWRAATTMANTMAARSSTTNSSVDDHCDEAESDVEFDSEMLTEVPKYKGVTKSGFPLPDSEPLGDWIEPGYDVYVISLQESISDTIFKAIEQYLNRVNKHSTFIQIQYDDLQLSGLGDGAYLSPKSTTIACWVSDSVLHPLGPVKSVTSKSVSLSMINGSKGAVCLVLCIHGQFICFVGCHLPATNPEARVKAREVIARKLSEAYSGHLGIQWKDVFHHIVWMGDFNFRVQGTSASEMVDLLCSDADGVPEAFKFDELHFPEMSDDLVADEFEELPVKFLPSYKMKDGRGVIDRTKTNWADDLYATLFKVRWYKGGKKKERVPSWTDRIFKRSMPELYFCCSFNEDSYKAAEATFYNVLLGSDHTPVRCCFSLYPLADNLALPTVLLRIDEEKMDKINRNTIANYAKMKYRSTHLTIGSGSYGGGGERALMNPVPSLCEESESQNVMQSAEEPNMSSIGRILDHVGTAGAGSTYQSSWDEEHGMLIGGSAPASVSSEENIFTPSTTSSLLDCGTLAAHSCCTPLHPKRNEELTSNDCTPRAVTPGSSQMSLTQSPTTSVSSCSPGCPTDWSESGIESRMCGDSTGLPRIPPLSTGDLLSERFKLLEVSTIPCSPSSSSLPQTSSPLLWNGRRCLSPQPEGPPPPLPSTYSPPTLPHPPPGPGLMRRRARQPHSQVPIRCHHTSAGHMRHHSSPQGDCQGSPAPGSRMGLSNGSSLPCSICSAPPEDTPSTFGMLIKKVRSRLGISRSTFARVLGETPNAVTLSSTGLDTDETWILRGGGVLSHSSSLGAKEDKSGDLQALKTCIDLPSTQSSGGGNGPIKQWCPNATLSIDAFETATEPPTTVSDLRQFSRVDSGTSTNPSIGVIAPERPRSCTEDLELCDTGESSSSRGTLQPPRRAPRANRTGLSHSSGYYIAASDYFKPWPRTLKQFRSRFYDDNRLPQPSPANAEAL